MDSQSFREGDGEGNAVVVESAGEEEEAGEEKYAGAGRKAGSQH
jgi:hypothetical protein